MTQTVKANSAQDDLKPYARFVGEWLFWIVLIGLYYQQTGFFDKEISNYDFGAAGWPRAVCLAAMVGATFQLALQIRSYRSGLVQDGGEAEKTTITPRQWAHRLSIFCWPFIFLYFTPILGAYVSIPLFVAGLLILLGVRSVTSIALVTFIVYGLTLLIFTRFFFVALPVGSEYLFYDINVAIIEFARIGR